MSAAGRPWAGRRLHFVGVGGAGMSGYARAASALGASVSGSDRADSPYLARLREEGVLDASIGHDAANLPDGEGVELVYSSAIPPENSERLAAQRRGVPQRPRAWLLGELTALRRTIAVAGTHGKTTTSAMVVQALRGCGLDPGWLIGGSPGPGLANSHWSESPWLVVEADESDRSMLSLQVEVAVLTNVELDHHSEFASLRALRETFATFLAHAGAAIVVWDRPELLRLLAGGDAVPGEAVPGEAVPGEAVPGEAVPGEAVPGEAVPGEAVPGDATSGGSQVAGVSPVEIVSYDVPDPRLHAGGSSFDWRGQQVRLAVPGAHNALNAAAALEAARLAGADPGRAAAALADFHGAGRRFERLGWTALGALIVDDYAHHPTEIRATLRAARSELASTDGERGRAPRLVAVFQPHLYSRTQRLAAQFGAALAEADAIAVLDVYPSRERAEDHPGVSGLLVAQAAAAAAAGREVMWLPSFEDAAPVLARTLMAGDVCVVMGAGDVDALARRLATAPLASERRTEEQRR